ncbi:aldo/keto reductase [Trichocoleus sp. FACHB-591]|uniref:aldo/keto reductase n=1 Tax=Trichocoleus sp. FACHB-591 TaxID=2692872 RepID=UPI00351C3321
MSPQSLHAAIADFFDIDMELKTIAGNPISCLGLASRRVQESACIAQAFEAGVNYFFFYNLGSERFLETLKLLASAQRENLCIATGSEQRSSTTLREYLDQVRKTLAVDVVDIFFAQYVSPSDNPTEVAAALEELYEWKAQGYVRYVGVSTHNRAIALDMIQNQRCDVLMHRYNMAHRKAEVDVLPTAVQTGIPVVAFTATRWGTLLRSPADWPHDPPSAIDCYRFSLQPSAIPVVLTSPANLTELTANLSVLQTASLTSPELVHWRQYGDFVYGNGLDKFETQWL